MTSVLKSGIAAAMVLALAGAAQAALVSRGGGMVYGTTQNLTWLADMNHAATSGWAAAHATDPFPHLETTVLAGGAMGWLAANQWANSLVYGGFDDWRLPGLNTADTSCSHNRDLGSGLGVMHCGFGCSGGELSHLFVVDLGADANGSIMDTQGDTAEQVANLALFSNIQNKRYWSASLWAPDAAYAWYFDASDTFQSNQRRGAPYFALAVRTGDVGAVPEPQTFGLAVLALCAAIRVRRPQRT